MRSAAPSTSTRPPRPDHQPHQSASAPTSGCDLRGRHDCPKHQRPQGGNKNYRPFSPAEESEQIEFERVHRSHRSHRSQTISLLTLSTPLGDAIWRAREGAEEEGHAGTRCAKKGGKCARRKFLAGVSFLHVSGDPPRLPDVLPLTAAPHKLEADSYTHSLHPPWRRSGHSRL